MTLIYLVRHGETDWNRARRIQGSTDIPLNDTGRRQAAQIGKLLSRHSWDGIASSPLSRAAETAHIIADAVGFEAARIDLIEALVERHYGEAEGLDDLELAHRYPADEPVPGREPGTAVARRAIPALLALAQGFERAHAGQRDAARLIVASHGGVIRTLLNKVTDGSQFHRGIPITNGSVHSFRHRNGVLELVRFNDPIGEEKTT